ncbi:MAG TPA: hypothetical protein VMZ28_18520 [Kofleriaceae bacterium]|nr:hypothetical protein [Kofleriaceae bacterium]
MRLILALVLLAPASARADVDASHVRLTTAHGPVHLWTPPTYDPATAGIALYVHGYYTTADKAWTDHHLAEQFLASGRNALFVVPEAPAGLRPAVNWASLHDLLIEIRVQTGRPLPRGPLVAVFHSGAFRTAALWLEHPELREIVLLDAMYDEEDTFAAWLRQPLARPNRMILVGADTLRWTEPFAREARDDGVADRLHYVRGGEAHMDLVTAGAMIPALLQLTALPAAAAAP